MLSQIRGLTAAASAAVVAVGLGGCARSSRATPAPQGCSASTSSTAIGAVCHAVQAAAVTQAGGTLTSSIGNGTPLYKNEVITTGDQAGRVDFWISTEITKCRAYDGNPNLETAPHTVKLVVWPPLSFAGHQILLDYKHGYVTCGTLRHGQGIVLGVNGKVYITANDPVWTVEVDNDGTIKIRVYAGVVNVGKVPQDLRRVRNEEIVIEPNGTIEPPLPFKAEAMSANEQSAVAFVEH